MTFDLFGNTVQEPVKGKIRAIPQPPHQTPPQTPKASVCSFKHRYRHGDEPREMAGMAKVGDVVTIWHK